MSNRKATGKQIRRAGQVAAKDKYLAKEPFILGIIPARGGSKSLKKKNIQPLGGKPLIAYTIEASQKCRYLSYTVVSTDDEEIGQVAREYGGEVPFIRPAHLAQDDSPTVPVLRHAVETIEAQKGVTADPIVLLQPTSPFRTGEDIDACIELFLELKPDVIFSAQRSSASPYYNLVEMISGTPWVTLCKEADGILSRRQEAPSTWTSHGAVIVYDRQALFECEHHLWMERAAIFEMSEERIFDIDSKRDLMLAEFLLKHATAVEGGSTCED